MHGTKAIPWCSQFCPSWVVLSGPCLPRNIVWACVPSQLAFAVLCPLSSRKCTVRFWKGTQKTFVPRSASVVELLIAVLLVPLAGVNLRTALRRIISCSEASHAGAGASEASVFVPAIAQQVQSSAETAAAETNEELVQQVVLDGSAQCSCVSCFCTSSLSGPLGCPARFCSPACWNTHQASCPLVAFAKPVMVTFHESLKRASIGLAVAQQGVPVLNPCSVMFQRSFSATGCFTAGSLHPLARSPTVEFGVSLRPWFNNFQHIELHLSGPRAALGRSRAQVRDAGRVLSGLVSGFRQALLDGSFWLALLPKRGKFWGSQVLFEGSQVECCVPIACPCLNLLRFHFGPVCLVAQLSRAPPFSVQPSLVVRLLFQKWSFHQVSSCQRPRS